MKRLVLGFVLAASMAAPSVGYAAGSSSMADVNIGDVKRYVDRGDYGRAIRKAEEYLQSNPRSADAYNYIGYSERKLENYKKARKAYDRALAIDSKHVGAHEYYGELHITLGNLSEAEKHLATLTAICGSCAEQQELAGKLAKAKTGG
jgi:tetratricopeptide (TPR) repeat protein